MSEHAEPEITLESIDNALQDLVKAAEATDLVKAYGGVAIDSTGVVDNRGKVPGGYPEKGDVGELDSMMVGRMQAALVESGFPASAIAAFMRGKQEEDEDEGEDDTEEMEGKMGRPASTQGGVGTNPRVRPPAHGSTMAKMNHDDEDDAKYGKSLDAFTEDSAIADAIDVSPFLEALVQRTAEQLDGLAKSQAHQSNEQREVNRTMASVLYGIGQLVKGMAPVLSALDERLSLVERQPQPAKGRTQLSGARPMAKSFGSHGVEGQGVPQLQKSQVARVLSYMNMEKGIKDIGGQPTYQLACMVEGGNQVTQQTLGAVHKFLATHPSEAAAALSYR